MIRQIGGHNDNPTVVDAIKRIKHHCLSWGGKLPTNASVELEGEEFHLSLSVRMMQSFLTPTSEDRVETEPVYLDLETSENDRLDEENYVEVF